MELANLKNIYPAIYIQHGEERTTISLEWYQENKEHVDFVSFALIFLYRDGTKKEHYFQSYEEMMEAMQKIVAQLKK